MRKVLAVFMCLVLCLGLGQSLSFAADAPATTADAFTLVIDQGSCTINKPDLTFTGVANRNCTVSFSLNSGVVAKFDVKANEKFSQQITQFVVGSNKLRVSAMDADFNSTQATPDLTIRYMTNAPMMIVDQIPNYKNEITTYNLPEFVDTTATFKYTVSGTLDKAGSVRIYINDDNSKPIYVQTSGKDNKFSTVITLGKANYKLYITPFLPDNVTGGTSATVYLSCTDGTKPADVEPPTATLDQKTSTVDSPEFTLTGSISEKGVMRYKLNSSSWNIVQCDANNKYSTKITLKEGNNNIRVQAVDESNNVSTATVSINVTYEKDYTAPKLTLDQSTSSVANKAFTLSGSLDEKGKVKVTLNKGTPIEVAVDQNNKFSTNLTLNDGENTIDVVAVDVEGNASDPSTINITVEKPVRPSTEIAVMLNGQYVNFGDVPPAIMNGRTMVPMRAVFELFGAKIDWNGDTKTVTGTKGDNKVVLTIDNPTAYINGNAITLDAPATIKDSRTLVPLRFIAEALNANVNWDPATKTAIITLK